MDVYMSDAGDQEMKLQMRALDESLAESSRLNKLVELAAIDPGSILANVNLFARKLGERHMCLAVSSTICMSSKSDYIRDGQWQLSESSTQSCNCW